MSNTGWTTEESFDWDNTSTEPPPPLEDGIYRAKVVKAEAEATSKNVPGVSLQLQVLRSHADPSAELNRKMFDKLVFSKDAAFRVKQCGQATEVALPSSSGYEAVKEFADSLVGAEVWIRTKRQTYQGKTNARVDRYIAEKDLEAALAGGTSAAPVGDADEAAPRRRRRG